MHYEWPNDYPWSNMTSAEFARLHHARGKQIMWFLGAGASSAAGVATEFDMIWEFKRLVFCTENRLSIRHFADLGDPAVRHRIQISLDGTKRFPSADSESEYSAYFESTHPSQADRRRYIEQAISAARPSYGHIALAALMQADKISHVWTTNFDKLPENAAAAVFGDTNTLVVATPQNANVATEASREGRVPLLCKLHGDYQSSQLKNTTEELRYQEAALRQLLTEECRRRGLAVIGYSGRDNSVLDALEEAIDAGKGFPEGLFWFVRRGARPFVRVAALIDTARAAGVEAHFVQAETFDEVMADLLMLEGHIPETTHALLQTRASRVSDAPASPGTGTYPIIRFNAFRVHSWPTVCRKVVCGVGGYKDVQQAIATANADIIASRSRAGVIGFGEDGEFKRVFDRFGIESFDLHSIDARNLRRDTQEHSLLQEALARAISGNRPVRLLRRGRAIFLTPIESNIDATDYAGIKTAAERALTGTVPDTQLQWIEALRIRLALQFGRLWLLVEPTVIVLATPEMRGEHRAKLAAFVKEQLARRYNYQWNSLLNAWGEFLTGGRDHVELRALGAAAGVDAAFNLSKGTAFSHRRV
jgi:NAD-dependent SIR2 family protein deacetylase